MKPRKSPLAVGTAKGARTGSLTKQNGARRWAARQLSREMLDTAKARVGIAAAWHSLGLPGEPRRLCCSPFRDERHPSFSISAEDRLWHDFADGTGGDVVSFIQRATGCDAREAIQRVLELAGGALASPVILAPRAAPSANARPAYDGLSCLDLQRPTLCEVIALAGLRDWPTFAGLELAASRGLLRMADVTRRGETHRSWIFTDDARRSAQARRLDGGEWPGDGYTFKSNSLRTDPEHPPGLADVLACDRRVVLLCEGEPDALAALLLAWCADLSGEMGVLCLTGARKPLAPTVLEKLWGRRCRVMLQSDPTGREGALVWAESIHAAGISVDLASLAGRTRADGQPAKDVADLCRRPAELENLEQLAADVLGNLLP